MTVSEYNKCVDLYADNVYRFVLKNIKDVDKAKDIVQDTYEKMWLKRLSVQAEKAKSYMFTTAYRTLIDLVRREKKQGNMDEANYNDLSHSSHYSNLNEVLHDAIDKLPADQKAVTMLRDYEGYSYKEIGEILDLSDSQVKVYLFRGRKKIKKQLKGVKELV